MSKLSDTIDFFKNHYGKILTGTTGTIIFTVVGTWFSDQRYAHQTNVDKQTIEIQKEIYDLKEQVEQLSKHK